MKKKYITRCRILGVPQKVKKIQKKNSALAFGRVFNGNCFLIFKNLIFIDFQWKLFFIFYFLSKKPFVGKINANRKGFYKKKSVRKTQCKYKPFLVDVVDNPTDCLQILWELTGPHQ